MRKAVKVVMLLITFVLTCSAAYADCKSGVYAMTKKDVLGAVSLEKYDEMDYAIRNKDNAKLDQMISDNSVAKLPSGKKACVEDHATYKYSKKISIPGMETEYWVNIESLTDVR